MAKDRWGAWVAAMRAGQYAEAWRISDAVLAAHDPATRDDPSVDYHRRWVWDGRPVEGRDLLVRCYHGLGDTLQFARFLPAAAERARLLTVEAQPPLTPLIRAIAPQAMVHSFDPVRPLPPGQVDAEITELSHALRIMPEEAAPPYLSVSPAALPPGTIGLCHGAGAWDPERWVPPELFAPLCALRPSVALRPEPTELPVLNPAGCSLDMIETARLIAGCALVITVDTMVAHLAGALGRPCWVLLKADPDWRWNPSRKGSAWYPNTRLYVQPQPGAWASMMEAVERDLAEGVVSPAGFEPATY